MSSPCYDELEQQQFIDNMNKAISPELARALEYVKKMRRPPNDDPTFIVTSSSEWCHNA